MRANDASVSMAHGPFLGTADGTSLGTAAGGAFVELWVRRTARPWAPPTAYP